MELLELVPARPAVHHHELERGEADEGTEAGRWAHGAVDMGSQSAERALLAVVLVLEKLGRCSDDVGHRGAAFEAADEGLLVRRLVLV